MIPAAKLDRLLDRFHAIESEMASGANGDAFVKLSREHAELAPVIETARAYRQAQLRIGDAEALISDPSTENEIKTLAEEERGELKQTLEKLGQDLRIALLPKDAADDSSAIVEIRAGTGGDEAALFAADLLEMYQRYCALQGWRTEVMDRTESDLGGIKDATLEVNGRGAYAKLKFESGVHRVQRVPATESQGRIHTSAATVAVLPEAEDVDVQINEKDLRIDVFRAQGAGGQHVNKTESAVRITHLPTGIAVASQSERSQHQNRAICWDMLKSKLYEIELEKKKAETGAYVGEKSDIGWGHQIRSYVLQPYQLVKDLRTGVESRAPQDVLDGDLDPFMAAALAQEVGGKPREKVEDLE